MALSLVARATRQRPRAAHVPVVAARAKSTSSWVHHELARLRAIVAHERRDETREGGVRRRHETAATRANPSRATEAMLVKMCGQLAHSSNHGVLR